MAKTGTKQIVLVLDKHRKPLMPTTRCGHVRHLLDSGRAVVVKKNPFTIRLKYESATVTQQVILGIDPGRTNIGMTSIDNKGNTLHSVHGITNNKDIPKRMEKRAAHRRDSRSGERKRRRRRAREHGTSLVPRNASCLVVKSRLSVRTSLTQNPGFITVQGRLAG